MFIVPPKDVTIVIQGQTNHYKRVLDNIDPKYQYLWSTWTDEPRENLNDIIKRMPLVLSEKFPNCGRYNVNYQCHSSEEGIKHASTPWVVKIRGDLLWTNQEKLITAAFNDIVEKNSFAGFLSYKPSINEIHDFISFSSKENGIKLWSHREHTPTHKSPEHQLCDHLCNTLKLSYDEMVKRMSFVNVFMEEKVVDLYCIKYDVSLGYQCNITWGGVEQFPKKVQA